MPLGDIPVTWNAPKEVGDLFVLRKNTHRACVGGADDQQPTARRYFGIGMQVLTLSVY